MNGISDAAIPPLDGSVTIPDTLDFHWEHNPTLPIYAYPGEGADEITTISYLEFGRACHRVAHALNPDPRSPKREVVAIIALVDTVLYHAVVVGLMKAGLVVCQTCAVIASAVMLTNTSLAFPNIASKHTCGGSQLAEEDVVSSPCYHSDHIAGSAARCQDRNF